MANARLIAAAPDLLKALEDIASYYPNNWASDTARAASACAESFSCFLNHSNGDITMTIENTPQPTSKKGFAFELGQQVTIAVSGEAGQVNGRAEYVSSENTYYVIYKSADGRAVTTWWDEAQLKPTK